MSKSEEQQEVRDRLVKSFLTSSKSMQWFEKLQKLEVYLFQVGELGTLFLCKELDNQMTIFGQVHLVEDTKNNDIVIEMKAYDVLTKFENKGELFDLLYDTKAISKDMVASI